MYKISELIGKQSITLLDADSCGVVAGAFFDRALTKCKYFLLLNDDDENRYFVDYKNLSSVLEDAIVIKSARNITEQPSGDIIPSPINLPAFNQDGKALGVIRDIVMEGDLIVSFTADSGEIAAGTMLSRSDSIVVFNDTGKPLKIKPTNPSRSEKSAKHINENGGDFTDGASKNRSRTLSKKHKQAGIDHIAENEKEKSYRIETPSKISPIPPTANPNIALSKYYFLLGKRLQRSIYTQKGMLIAKENDLITESVIQNAKDGGKLVAIALHSI